MKLALCGYSLHALQLHESLKDKGIEFKYFIGNFMSKRGSNFPVTLPTINFFDFRRLINAGELDGIIITEDSRSHFTREVIRVCKFYDIPHVGIADLFRLNHFNPVFMLDVNKSYIGFLQANLVDGCNLNCKGCTHYSGLFGRDEIYPLETFRRDIRRLSQICDVRTFCLLGGEPLLLENLDEYIKISRQYLHGTELRIFTNGLLIPSLPQKILDSIRENNCRVDVSVYSPTLKIVDKIKQIFTSNNINFYLNAYAKSNFNVFLTLHAGNNPEKARVVCINDDCRFLRDGKIYKCPVDANSYRFAEKFGLKNFPKATGVDLYGETFSLLIEMLDGNVEMCGRCAEKVRKIPWEPTNNPKLEDWLADPAEAKALH